MTEIERVRLLLDELKRVNGELEAPTKLEGWKEMKAAARSVYNTHFFISSGFVADKCAAILAVCGDRLTPNLRTNYERMLQALRRVEAAESVHTGNSHETHLQKEARVKTCIRLVASVEWSMNNEVLNALRQLTGTEGLNIPWGEIRKKLKEMQNDSLAVALNAFFDAMKVYRTRHKEEFTTRFTDYD